jgi:hypothetical protein
MATTKYEESMVTCLARTLVEPPATDIGVAFERMSHDIPWKELI